MVFLWFKLIFKQVYFNFEISKTLNTTVKVRVIHGLKQNFKNKIINDKKESPLISELKQNPVNEITKNKAYFTERLKKVGINIIL